MLFDPLALDCPDDPLLFFDDAPLDVILYGDGVPGEPTRADIFAPARPILAAIGQAIADHREEEALADMRRIYDNGWEIPAAAAAALVAIISRSVPVCAWPILPASHYPYDTILRPLFERAMTDGQSELADSGGSLCTRYYEAEGRFKGVRPRHDVPSRSIL